MIFMSVHHIWFQYSSIRSFQTKKISFDPYDTDQAILLWYVVLLHLLLFGSYGTNYFALVFMCHYRACLKSLGGL